MCIVALQTHTNKISVVSARKLSIQRFTMQQRWQVLCFAVILFAASSVVSLEVEEDIDDEYGTFKEPSKSKLLLEDEWEAVSRKKRQEETPAASGAPAEEEAWTGRWLPERTTESSKAASVATTVDLHDDKHGIKMGIPNAACDDGKVNITLDWDMSPVNYTCYNPSHLFIPRPELPALLETETIPEGYVPAHLCLSTAIEYDRPVPTFGNHRPLWPKYGEYKFLPRQRWLHSIEHGAIVMLYHPCANPVEVNRLRRLVTSCIRRHIITPFTLLDETRPMVLVAWGHRLTMSMVDPEVVRAFIRQKSKQGWEGYDAREGQFESMLEVPSIVPVGSDFEDTVICPYQ